MKDCFGDEAVFFVRRTEGTPLGPVVGRAAANDGPFDLLKRTDLLEEYNKYFEKIGI